MLDPVRLLSLSGDVERGLRVGALLLVVWLLARAFLARRRPVRRSLAIAPRAERTVIALVLVWVLATCLVGAGWSQQPRWYFSQVSTLHIADALRKPQLGRRWLALLGNLQVKWEHESPIQAPVAALFQRLLGPSIELPTFIGALWAALAVVVAWRLGRTVESPAFGVLFATMLAISPLQITWSRLGGIYIAAGLGGLLALQAGWAVGRRGGVVTAFLLGIVAWSCGVCFYYPARVGMGLAFVALFAGWRQAGRGLGRLGALVAAAAAGLIACVLVQRALVPGQSLWPEYGGYLGNRGETTVRDWLVGLWTVVQAQTRFALAEYFWSDRMPEVGHQIAAAPARWPGTSLALGMAAGGLVLLPVLLLGLLGILRSLRRPVERGLWLVVAVCGLLPSVIGFPSARRFLVLDVGWCALAALGLLGVLESRLLDPTTPSGRWRWGGALLAGVGLWSVATLGLSDAVLPGQDVRIPFADSGFGDGATCLGCIQTARSWQREIEDGRMVIALDTDMYRENATAPGGLMLYGKTAALAAGRPELFVEYYAIVTNNDRWPPRPGPIARSTPEDVAAAFGERIEAARPTAIVWWFGQPNAWERRLADALVAGGSSRTSPPPRPMWGATRASVSSDPIRVETPWDRRRDALAALRRLVDPAPPPRCVQLVRVARRPHDWPLMLAPATASGDGPPEWAVASWGEAEIWGRRQPAHSVVGFDYGQRSDGRWSADLVDALGAAREWTEGGEESFRKPPPGPRPLGLDCAAFHDGEWWVVDPVAGTLWIPGDPPTQLPLGAIGLAQSGDDLLVATADQEVQVLNTATRQVVRRFSATIVPTSRFDFGECAMLAAGRGWIASFDSLRGFIHLYDGSGAPLGRLSLTRVLGTGPTAVHTIRGAGDYLGVGHGLVVTTLRVVRDGTCGAGGPSVP